MINIFILIRVYFIDILRKKSLYSLYWYFLTTLSWKMNSLLPGDKQLLTTGTTTDCEKKLLDRNSIALTILEGPGLFSGL